MIIAYCTLVMIQEQAMPQQQAKKDEIGDVNLPHFVIKMH